MSNEKSVKAVAKYIRMSPQKVRRVFQQWEPGSVCGIQR